MRKNDGEFYTNPGSRVVPIYSPVVDKDGHIDLVVSGYDDIQEKIDSFAERTDIRYILARAQAGEVDLLAQTKGVFGDFSSTPRTLAEALQLQIDSGRLFDSLPIEVRKKFNFDANEFLAQAGTEKWFSDIGIAYPEQMRSMNNTPPAPSTNGVTPNTTDAAPSES